MTQGASDAALGALAMQASPLRQTVHENVRTAVEVATFGVIMVSGGILELNTEVVEQGLQHFVAGTEALNQLVEQQ